MAKSFVRAIELTEIDAATLDGNYSAINPDGLPNACFLIRIINDSNITIVISYAEETDQDVLLPNTTLQLNLQNNSSPNGYVALMAKGTIVSVRSASGLAGVGAVDLIGYYQEV